MQPPGNINLPPTNNDLYLLVINGKPAGPFTIAQLRERKIKSGDFVKTPEMDDYKEAHEIAALRQLFGFNRQPLPMQYFGSFDQRGIAMVIDWLVVLAAFVVAALFIGIILWVALPGDDNRILRIAISAGIAALTPIGKVIYNVRMESGSKRGTLGKQLMKIRVCNLYGEQISQSQAIGRNVGKYLSTATFFIGYIMCFFTAKQQCLHDMFADTVVIKDRLDG